MTPWPNSQHMLVAQELPCATRQAQIPLGWEFCPIFPQFCGVVRRQAHTVGAQRILRISDPSSTQNALLCL